MTSLQLLGCNWVLTNLSGLNFIMAHLTGRESLAKCISMSPSRCMSIDCDVHVISVRVHINVPVQVHINPFHPSSCPGPYPCPYPWQGSCQGTYQCPFQGPHQCYSQRRPQGRLVSILTLPAFMHVVNQERVFEDHFRRLELGCALCGC